MPQAPCRAGDGSPLRTICTTGFASKATLRRRKSRWIPKASLSQSELSWKFCLPDAGLAGLSRTWESSAARPLQKVDGGSSPLTETRCRWHMAQQDEALNRGSVKSNAPVSRYDGRCARGGNSGRQGAASRRRAFRPRNLSNAESFAVSKSAPVVSAFRFRSWGFPALCLQLCGCRRHPRRRPPIG